MNLKDYIPLIKFIGDFLGMKAELILYNTIEEEIEYIHNSFNPEIKKGSPIPEAEKQMIDEKLYETEDVVFNDSASSINRNKARSASHFLKDDSNGLIGIISINYKVDELIELRNGLNHFINGLCFQHDKPEDYYEGFDLSFKDMMYIKIQETLAEYNVSPERLSQDEKIELIGKLDEKGIFLIKGSVAELSKILDASEASVYRYINKI